MMARTRPGHAAAVLAVAMTMGFGVVEGGAQDAATVRGQIRDEETGEPVRDAVIRFQGRDPVNADSIGRFEVTGLPVGQIEVRVEAVGYASHSTRLRLSEGQVLEWSVALEFDGTRLPAVEVRARAERLAPRYIDFERRRGRGLGAFFRWDELKERGFSSLGDALRTVRGVRIQCNQQTYECHAVMARARSCPPTWWVDGVEVRSFHENTPIRDVYGIEIYRGPGEIPGDFGGSNAACGVIVVWTKSRPYR